MQFNPNNPDDKKDSVPKYFTENVYREIAKSMNEFSQDTVNGGDNMNLPSHNRSEIPPNQDRYLGSEANPTYPYTPMYIVNPVVSQGIVPAQPVNQIPEYQTPIHQNQPLMPENYRAVVPDNSVPAPKVEYPNSNMTPFERPNHEQTMSPGLNHAKSPVRSPSLPPSSNQPYQKKPEPGNASPPGDGKQGEMPPDHQGFCTAKDDETQYQNTGYGYGSVSFSQVQRNGMTPNQPIYYNLQYKEPASSNKEQLDPSVSFDPYAPKKDVCYFNNIRPIYDENSKTYYPSFQVMHGSNGKINHRPQILPNELINSRTISPLFKYISEGQKFEIPNPYENANSYFKSTSIKQDMAEPQDEVDLTGKKAGQNEFMEKQTQERRKATKTSAAGRPKLNRNHYSCANCNAKTTPQWRYVRGIAVCNACYMRMRKDKVFPISLNKERSKKNSK